MVTSTQKGTKTFHCIRLWEQNLRSNHLTKEEVNG